MKNNFVAKHARSFNKSAKMRDKKNDYTRKGKDKVGTKRAGVRPGDTDTI